MMMMKKKNLQIELFQLSKEPFYTISAIFQPYFGHDSEYVIAKFDRTVVENESETGMFRLHLRNAENRGVPIQVAGDAPSPP